MPLIILASQSPARKRLLKRLGFAFRTKPSHIDEDSFKAASPRALVQKLAHEKARVIAEKNPDAIVIGSDQMLILGKRVFGKPHTVENANKQLIASSGKTVDLLTAVTVFIPSEILTNRARSGSSGQGSIAVASFLDVTRMTFRQLTRAEIAAYVAQDQPLQCAGSFMFEKNGIRLFEKIETEDATAIEGLPMLKLNKLLRHALFEC